MWLATSCSCSSVYALPNGGIDVPATPERAVVMMSSWWGRRRRRCHGRGVAGAQIHQDAFEIFADGVGLVAHDLVALRKRLRRGRLLNLVLRHRRFD